MIPTNLSSKGQLTIPKRFRQRMKLAGRRRVFVEQRPNGVVLIRPAPSILELAGKLQLKRPLLSPEDERRETHALMARSTAARRRRR
jgi:bifunctional DNA-binding transcriptional regulator/antitoxin component of YhaV-PrlF toxin-antitoxin module